MSQTIGFVVGLVVGFIAGMRLGPRLKNQEEVIPRAYTDEEMKALRQRAQLKAERNQRRSDALGEFLAPGPYNQQNNKDKPRRII